MTQAEAKVEQPSPLVRLLRQFNRKERYWLLADALGEPFLTLSPGYRQRVGDLLGITVPEYAWWALDYHFDWLHAALSCAPDYDPQSGSVRPNELRDTRRKITGTQEDIDLIIAFDQTIILIEAKGVTGWTNAQMKSKAARLYDLPYDPATTHIRLILTSPAKSDRLGKGVWATQVPKDMMASNDAYYHLPMLGLGGGAALLRVERCDGEKRPASDGEFWQIVSIAGTGP